MWYGAGSLRPSLGATNVYPLCLSHIFVGFRVIRAGSYGDFSTTDIAFTGIVAGTDVSLVCSGHTFPDSLPENVFNPKIWARKKIERLYARWLREDQPDTLRQLIINISFTYGLSLPFNRQKWRGAGVEDEFIETFCAKIHNEEDESSVCLHWIFRNDPSRIRRIEIHRVLTEGTTFQRVALLPADATYFFDVTADPLTSYRYRLDVILHKGERLCYECLFQPPEYLSYGLAQNYPNPFSTKTRIIFAIPRGPGHATLGIRDILGQEVKNLIDEEKQAGYYSVIWDGRDNRGQRVAEGVYLCLLRTPYFSAVRKMIKTA